MEQKIATHTEQREPHTVKSQEVPHDLYLALGLHPGASESEIREAFITQGERYSRREISSEDFLRAEESYKTLIDPVRRENYVLGPKVSPDSSAKQEDETIQVFASHAQRLLNEQQNFFDVLDSLKQTIEVATGMSPLSKDKFLKAIEPYIFEKYLDNVSMFIRRYTHEWAILRIDVLTKDLNDIGFSKADLIKLLEDHYIVALDNNPISNYMNLNL